MFKKIIVSLFIILSAITTIQAKMHFEASLNYTDAGDLKKQNGFGAGLGFDLMPDLIIYLKTKYGIASEKNGDEKYTHLMSFGVVEKNFRIQNYPIYWFVSVGLGYTKSNVNIENDATQDIDQSDNGIGYGFWVGGRYHLTQRVSPFIDLGYHKAIYANDFEDADVSGYQLNFGVTFSFFGKNNELYEGY